MKRPVSEQLSHRSASATTDIHVTGHHRKAESLLGGDSEQLSLEERQRH